MMAPTHCVFACFSTGLMGAVMNMPVAILGYGSSILGSLLPDIDTTTSRLGKVFLPLSTYLERRFGHRTLTHSLLGWSIFSLVGLPLLILRPKQIYFCFVLGVFSHIILDAVNKSGVPLFYPYLIRAVIPKNEKYRIFTASKEEFVFLGVLSSLALLVLPLNRIGVRGALHYLIKIPQSAVSDYLTYSAQGYETIVDFEGIFNVSQKRIKGRWLAINSTSKNSLILQSPDGKIYSIGSNPHDNIRFLKIQSFKGKPIKVFTQEVSLTEQPLSDILNHIPKEEETYLLGYIKTYDKLNLEFSLDEYPTLKAGVNRLDFDYASKEDILRQRLFNALANEGKILLMSFYSPKDKITLPQTKHSITSTPNPSQVITIYIKDIYNPRKELKVKPNDIVYKGKLLACQDIKRNYLLMDKKDAENRLEIAKSELDKLRIQIEEESQLKQKEDQLLRQERPLTLNKRLDEIKIFEAKAKVDLAKSNLEKIERKIKSTRIYSPVNGKVLSIRIQHTTVTLRIVTKEEMALNQEFAEDNADREGNSHD